MAFSVQMPALGESVTEGTVTRWLKQEGDRVEVDEPLLEVSTDKVDTEIPSPAAGVLQRIVAGEDETVEVGGELAVIADTRAGDPSEAPAPAEDTAPQPAPEAAEKEQPEPTPAPVAEPRPTGGSGQAITMPELGESVTEGTVTRWLKAVGDSVAVDEPLLEVSTDKVDTEIPSPIAGTLLEITAQEDETVDVGGRLAVIGTPGTGDASAAPAGEKAPEPGPEKAPEPAAAPSRSGASSTAEAEKQIEKQELVSEQPAGPNDRVDDDRPAGSAPAGAPYVTPLVRKLAAENAVDLSALAGSGVGGRIRKQDVIAAAESMKAPEPAPAPPPAPAAAEAPAPAAAAPSAPRAPAKPAAGAPTPGTTVKMPRLRQVIAQRMSESLAVSAQLTTVQEVDVTRVARLRARAKGEFERREGVKLTYLPFFVKATIEALKQFPQVNASINDESKEVTYHEHVHIAIAVDTPRGLLVPVIKNAEDLNIAGLARRIADVAARTRDSRIGPDELSGGTFTITNIGSAGALFDTPIINQPQVGILGTGAITRQAAVIAGADGEDVIAIRSMCYLPLTYDHRLVDGADAGRFVSAIKARLEEGAFEADLGL
jgi:2-oxoglutarate dehydrogenase E2 component (dihydrolipoamide succinyltransferase)